MSKDDLVDVEATSPSVQTHLSIIQGVIQRMAGNSASCKAWCITLVSAILVVVADKGKGDYALIALLPCLLFAFLDAYYLALEKGFRKSYNDFVSKLHRDALKDSDLYSMVPTGGVMDWICDAFKSASIWAFYLPLSGVVWVTKTVAIG